MRNLKQRRQFWLGFAFCFSLLLGHAVHGWAQTGDGLLIYPLNRSFQMRPGSKAVAEFRVSNGLKFSTTFEVGLHDLTQNIRGNADIAPVGSTPRSAAPWIEVTQGRISLAPGKEQIIRATITAPLKVSGSYHAALALRLFVSTTSNPDGSTAAVVNQTLLPIHVYIPGTLQPAVELQGAALKPAEGNIMSMVNSDSLVGKWVLLPRVKNTGNSMVRLKGDIIVTSQKGELVGRYQVSGGDADGQAILPNATVEFPIFIDSTLPDTQYPARVSLRFQGTRRVEGYSAPLTLTPRSEGSTAETPLGTVALGTVERTGLQALVEPRFVIGNVRPNTVRSQRITVTNLEDFPVNVRASASGVAIDTDGEPIALPDAATADWVTIAPSFFRLGAGQNRIISVRLNAPTDDKDRWGLLEFALSSSNPTASTLTATARTTILLRNTTNTDKGQPITEKVALTRSEIGPIVSVTINNPRSRALAFASSALQLDAPALENTPEISQDTLDKSAGTETPLSFNIKGENDIALLPGSSRRLDFQLPPNIAPAQYRGVLMLRGLTPASSAKATEDFSVPFNLNLTVPKPAGDANPENTPSLAKSSATTAQSPAKGTPRP